MAIFTMCPKPRKRKYGSKNAPMLHSAVSHFVKGYEVITSKPFIRWHIHHSGKRVDTYIVAERHWRHDVAKCTAKRVLSKFINEK